MTPAISGLVILNLIKDTGDNVLEYLTVREAGIKDQAPNASCFRNRKMTDPWVKCAVLGRIIFHLLKNTGILQGEFFCALSRNSAFWLKKRFC